MGCTVQPYRAEIRSRSRSLHHLGGPQGRPRGTVLPNGKTSEPGKFASRRFHGDLLSGEDRTGGRRVGTRGCDVRHMTNAWAEFERGWRVVAGSLLGISIGVSSLFFYSLGIFIKPIAAEFSWGRGAASLGALVGTASAALVAIPVGRLVDRVGSVPVAMGSLALLALALAALGTWTSNLASFLILIALLSLFTAGSTPLAY